MGDKTKIEWCDKTFNPWWGCTKVSPACDHCYAESFAKRVGHSVWGKESERRFFGDSHWNEPLKWDRQAAALGVRYRVFCASMADVMEDRMDLDTPRQQLWRLIEATPNLDWLLLSKRPQNFRKMLPKEWRDQPRPNVWLMTTVESQNFMWRVEALLNVPAVIHGVSYEPALGPVRLAPYLRTPFRRAPDCSLPALDWVIAGGESGGHARPANPDWFRSVRDDCALASVPFLFKQWGEYAGTGIFNPRGVRVDSQMGFSTAMVRIGKKEAGRLLDGREYNEFPVVRL